MARPKKEINWDVVEKLLESGCNGIEIAAKFQIQDDTFYRRFQEEYGFHFQDYKGKFHSAGEAELRLMQHLKALNNNAPGNAQLLIWLGKIRLGQKELENTLSVSPNQCILDQQHKIMQLEAELEILREGRKNEG